MTLARIFSATEGDDPDAMTSIALDCINNQEYTVAASWIERALSIYSADSYALWLKYRLISIGTVQVPQDERYNILQKSAKGLCYPAILELADLYANGKSKGGKIKMDKAQAAAWYKMAKACDADLTAEQEAVYTQLNAKNTQRADALFNEYKSLL